MNSSVNMLLLKKPEAQSDKTPSSSFHPAFPCQVSQTALRQALQLKKITPQSWFIFCFGLLSRKRNETGIRLNIIRYTRPHFVSKKTGIHCSSDRIETFCFKRAISRSFFMCWWERGKIWTTDRNLDRFKNLTYGTNVSTAIY